MLGDDLAFSADEERLGHAINAISDGGLTRLIDQGGVGSTAAL